ncbi:hypothetical protein [Sphingomonas montanisoli]|uniref:Uncharacterized protein n=1 Tax=Sphingomonas montanisoli TaxID=2606412 RepID=A0A5D9C3Q2_9SPHN|nr:hypothetical protein [Sphingomonas montanisoli]TZG26478.1 hypothetical protein FYJ91_16270 [Sphingomonas montanisoli]
MKNKLIDLNNHLFAQLERLGEESMTAEQIEAEAQRADAIVSLSDQIIRNADLQLKAVTILANHGDRFRPHLTMLQDKSPS